MQAHTSSIILLVVFSALAGCKHSRPDSGSASVSGALNQAPAVAIDFPFTGSSFAEGEEVRFEGSAVDPEDGPLRGASLQWTSDRDGPIGDGERLSTRALSRGLHDIRLIATDSGGASGSASVFIHIAERPASSPRAGQTNPYAGRLQRTPAKLDDELILVGRSKAQNRMLLGIVDDNVTNYTGQPSTDPAEPRITTRRAATEPVAAAAGRVIGSNLHQAAIVVRTTGADPQFRLEIVGLSDPGEHRIAEYRFQPPFLDAGIDVAVADLDAFEGTTGKKTFHPPEGVNAEYHDEVALAYLEPAGGELRARIEVLSFETAGFPLDDTAPVPGPATVRAALTSQPMHPASRVVLRHGDSFFGSRLGPHLVAAYIDVSRRIAIDVFEYRHTREDSSDPDPLHDERSLEHVLHAVISSPLGVAAVAAGGWDVAVGRAGRLGMAMLASFDVVLVVHNALGSFVQQAWKMESLDGFEGPVLLGQASGEFARVSDGRGGEIGLRILPSSTVRVALGRIVDTVDNRCEALGLFVLADTNRGAVVQSLSAFIEDPFIGRHRFGPVTETPVWPHVLAIRNHAETGQTTKTSLAAGGFVSERNGLIDDRGDPAGVGTEFARDCEDVHSAPLLGPMPSFYVADPEASVLHAVTMLLGSVSGAGVAVTVAMDASIDERAILLAADADGDAAYYSAIKCIGGDVGDCRAIFLGDAELHYVIENIETANVVLQQPPKHVDYLPALGGIVNVSMRDGYFAEFAQTDRASGSVTRRTKTDWSIGGRIELGLGPPVPKDKEFSSLFDMSLDAEHRSVQEQFSSTEVAVSLTQTTGAIDDDVVWSKRQTIDFWRFPAQGGKSKNRAREPGGFPEDAYMEIAIPEKPATLIGPGTLNENYQPAHMPGNILSYPTFSGDVDDLGELFGFLGSYVPSDENGTRKCQPLEDGDVNGCLILVNNALQQVAEVLAGDDFVGGEFQRVTTPIDVAEVLQVGGISYSAELEFETAVKNGLTVTNNDTIKAEVNLKIPLSVTKTKGPLQFGEVKAQLRAAASFENARVSENTVGSKTRVALHLPAEVPVERSYQIRPSFGFTPGGSLKVSYQVNTGGVAATFWERHYGGPDPALNMPHRIVRTQEGFQLGTDFSRRRIKGFFARDGKGIDPRRPHERRGDLLVEVPHAGDPVQLEVRVYNLSVAAWVGNLEVLFTAQIYRGGEGIGSPVPIGRATIDFLPYRGQFPDDPEGHIASAFILWDTTAFAPPRGESLITYLVHVTLDPEDRIRNETHELFDRRADPLVGPAGEVLDPLLEKGQNNTGWAMVRIAPPLSQGAQKAGGGASSSKAGGVSGGGDLIHLTFDGEGGRLRGAPVRGKLREPLRLSIGLRSERPVLDYGLLQVFDGDPDGGGLMILSRTVQGIADDVTLEEFLWRPATPGPRVLHALYVGAEVESRAAIQIPVVIED